MGLFPQSVASSATSLEIAAETELLPPGLLSRGTLHRLLRAHGLSARPKSAGTTKDLDRFEVSSPNDIWQSDMRTGPWLPDPDRPGKMRRTWLYVFLDDHSRLLLAGRFSSSTRAQPPSAQVSAIEALTNSGTALGQCRASRCAGSHRARHGP